jgi:glutaconyl-CoA/methylmalonyl-CoA decarboxylase subunit gamma
MKITVKINDSSYDVEVGDINARPVLATLNGESYEVWPESAAVETSTPAEVKTSEAKPPAPVARNAAVSQPGGDTSKAILAPLPGVIISIAVKAGDAIAVGQEACVLEAMKMKNSIKSTRSGKISAVRINQGDHVQHGQILFEFSD